MIHYSEKNRSRFCHLITDFHSINQKRAARFDLWGMSVSALMATALVTCVRLLVSH